MATLSAVLSLSFIDLLSYSVCCIVYPVLDGLGLFGLTCTNSGKYAEHPLPSNRRHQSNDDCPEDKRENYQVCSVQYCVQQLCTVQCAHT